MDLVTVFRIAIRRWYVFVPTLILCCLGGYLASTKVAPGYEVAGVLVVNTPYVTTEKESAAIANNSYSDTRSTASVLGGVAGSADTATAVAAQGGTATFQVLVQEGRPLIHVSVVGKTASDTLITYRLLTAELSKRLSAIQEAKQVPPPARVSLDDVVNPQQPLETSGSKIKVLLAAVGLGTILAFGLSVLADYRKWELPWARDKKPKRRPTGRTFDDDFDAFDGDDEVPVARKPAPPAQPVKSLPPQAKPPVQAPVQAPVKPVQPAQGQTSAPPANGARSGPQQNGTASRPSAPVGAQPGGQANGARSDSQPMRPPQRPTQAPAQPSAQPSAQPKEAPQQARPVEPNRAGPETVRVQPVNGGDPSRNRPR